MSDDPRENFEYFSNEYAQALQAFTAIENQASTIVAFGGSDDLRLYVDQFIEMAARTRAAAEDRGETHFVEWFDELLKKAEALRTEIVRS
jgi:hypothetical protein